MLAGVLLTKAAGITPTIVYASPRERDGPSDSRAIAVEEVHPQRVAQHGDRRPLRTVLVGGELAPHFRRHAGTQKIQLETRCCLLFGWSCATRFSALRSAGRRREIDHRKLIAKPLHAAPVCPGSVLAGSEYPCHYCATATGSG